MAGMNPLVLVAVLAALGLLPFMLMMVTSYVKIVVVISLVRNALGVQQVGRLAQAVGATPQHAIEVDGVGEVDYLSGDDAYKQDWMSQRRERVGLVAFRTDSLAGLAAAGRHFLGKHLRRRKSP